MKPQQFARAALAGLGTALLIAAPAIAQDVPACAPGTRLFESPLLLKGPLCVPEAPARTAFIDDTVLYALELGIPSVTSSYYSDVILADFPGYASRLATTTNVGNTWEMSGEVLLGADPDLVVTTKYWDDAIAYAEGIAPTIVIDDERAPTSVEIPRMLATLFGKDAEQAKLEADLDARLAALRQALSASGAGKSFSFTQIESATGFWTFTTEAFGTAFAIDAGLELGQGIPAPEDAARIDDGSTVAIPVAQENLDLIDADHIFFYANLGSDPAELVKDNPIFQRFAAQRPGRIHFLKGEYWFRAGATSAHRIIDDLYRDVLGEDPAAVSPNPLAWTYRTSAVAR